MIRKLSESKQTVEVVKEVVKEKIVYVDRDSEKVGSPVSTPKKKAKKSKKSKRSSSSSSSSSSSDAEELISDLKA